MVRASRSAVVGLFVLGLVSCKSDRPRDVPALAVADSGIEVKSRRSSALGSKLAWAGLVTNTGDRAVRSASVRVVARGAGGADVGRGSARVVGEGTALRSLPPRYGTLIEINAIDLSGAPERVEVTLEGVEHAREGEALPAWKPAQVAWEASLPDGVAFAVEKGRCGTVLAPDNASGTFGCTLGVRNVGTRPAPGLALRFQSPRSDEAVVVKPPHPTDLPIEPGDALVFDVSQPIAKPSEMILTGSITPRR